MKNSILLILFYVSFSAMSQDLIIPKKLRFLALGDSYTIGESVLPGKRWPALLQAALEKKGIQTEELRIIATTGWRTDDLKSAIDAAHLTADYNLVSLLIGVNNYYQGNSVESYTPEFEKLLNIAIALAGGHTENVFVISIPDYGYTPFGKGKQTEISKGIDAFNEANERIAKKLSVKYIYITDISRKGFDDPDLIASDGLHPSEKMYTAWVDRIMQFVTIN